MIDPAEFPVLQLRDGRRIASLADAIAYMREHEQRPGVDDRDERLHGLERAQTDRERQQATEAFVAWAAELNLLVIPREPARSG